jgi:acyl-CoA thioesterase I
MINPNSTILFQGDSITDTGRNREIAEPNRGAALGSGYVNLIAARLLQERPQDNLSFYNRGISGNRVTDLYARWKVDGINLQPDLISILIGVNDTWHEFMVGNGVEVDRYTTIYRMLLDYTKQRLPNVQLVLCEPFVLPCGVVTDGWIAEMDERRQVVRDLAGEFDAIFVPFQGVLDEALQQADPAYWAADGVHPTPAGHRLLADAWLAAVLPSTHTLG